MFISSLSLKQFRCFQATHLEFTKPLILIEGPNGSGKTSLLEALHYSCYLRSFRTRATRELMHFDSRAFSIKIQFTPTHSDIASQLSVGYSPEKRSIKINDTTLESYKELLSLYRVISITDDDLLLIKGNPEIRRSFLDSAITLIDHTYPLILRKYGAILEQRNALLQQQTINQDSYDLWTQQLVDAATLIRKKRQDMLDILSATITTLLSTFFAGTKAADISVSLAYKSKELPVNRNPLKLESAARHTLFGAHLDDCTILISQKSSKQYASRGQQKLIAILLKLSQPATQNPESCVFLLDDVVSDLDQDRLKCLFALLHSYKTQIIITSPVAHPLLHALCQPYEYERILIPHSPSQIVTD